MNMLSTTDKADDDYMSSDAPSSCILCVHSSGDIVGDNYVTCFGDYPSDSSGVLDKHLMSIFVLRKVLDLTKEDCGDLLRETGLDPGRWLTVCSSCSEVMRNAFELHRRIMALEKELEGLKMEVRRKLRDTFAEGNRSTGEKNIDFLSVHEIVRRKCWKSISKNKSGDVESILTQNDLSIPPTVLETSPPSLTQPGLEIDSYPLVKEEVNDILDKEPDDDWMPSDSDRDYHPPSPKIHNRPMSKPTTNVKKKKPKGYAPNAKAKPKKEKKPKIKKPRGPRKKAEKIHVCKECNNFRTHAKEVLEAHSRKHLVAKFITDVEPGNDVECNLCGKRFMKSDNMIWIIHHLQKEHSAETGMQRILCHLCEKTFSNTKSLREHVKTIHDGVKGYKCEECGETFSNSSILKYHVAKHTGITSERVVCDICGLSFTAADTLRRHRRQFHSKTFITKDEGSGVAVVCKHCGVQVVHGKALKLHLKTAHLELYKFPCDECDAVYMWPSNLKVHKETAHLKMTAECQFCGQTVGHRKSLREHWKKHCKLLPADQRSKASSSAHLME